ncbi:hypothetical protein GOODEAATRI_006432 [Goodea atripinnis]|uniref:Uncharacterized protein n=1 Tax=Goodea atripinnis TaxID=208336 RepID=A0ABV0MZ44_9TELE
MFFLSVHVHQPPVLAGHISSVIGLQFGASQYHSRGCKWARSCTLGTSDMEHIVELHCPSPTWYCVLPVAGLKEGYYTSSVLTTKTNLVMTKYFQSHNISVVNRTAITLNKVALF